MKLAFAGAAVVILSASVSGRAPAAAQQQQGATRDIVVYVSDLAGRAFSEFDVRNDPASAGGKFADTPNKGEELDPPPESDPYLTFQVPVQAGVAYRCWVHMKFGAPKGLSQANRFWVQLSNAVDKANKPIIEPGSKNYFTAQGPTKQGWVWVPCDPPAGAADPFVRFGTTGKVTVRLQAGMEGVGFDQFVLSPARFRDKAPTEAVVTK